MRSAWAVALAASLFLGSAAAVARPGDPPPASPRLERFESEAQFRAYLRAVERARQERRQWSVRKMAVRLAQAASPAGTATDTPQPLCPPEHPDCRPAEAAGEAVVVTGSRVTPHNASITNNQTVGVDEGDIVKQIGQYLIILQDGRLFTVDTRPGGAPGLAVADRVNVYRDPVDDGWYDEMLVSGDRILVTGYSYEREAAEFSVFRLDAGRLVSLGTFFLHSYDYYSSDNYATRLVGDRLVIYTPVDLSDIDLRKPLPFPRLWRWRAGDPAGKMPGAARLLLSIRDVYRPVLETAYPIIHAVSVCRLGEAGADKDLGCRTTGFVGPPSRELYVSPTDAFLWTAGGWDNDDLARAPGCSPSRLGEALSAAIYRLPISGGEPTVLGAGGMPVDHFALEAHGDTLRALVTRPPALCAAELEAYWRRRYSDNPPDPRLSFFSTDLAAFGTEFDQAEGDAYTPLPDPGSLYIADRFTDHYLVYGGMSRWGSSPPDPEEGEEARRRVPGKAFAVPFRRPSAVVSLPVGHTINRVERVGDDVVMTGYRDPSGLEISYVGLAGAPRVASTLKLAGRFESEGRSHAFNSLAEPGGEGLMGLPTVALEEDSPRWWFRSAASDVSFLSVDRGGRLASVGPLTTSVKQVRGPYGLEDQKIPGYECEVSCVDWYGNTRPIFTDGRVFALTGAELIEGRVEGGAIREVRRLMVAGPTRPRSP